MVNRYRESLKRYKARRLCNVYAVGQKMVLLYCYRDEYFQIKRLMNKLGRGLLTVSKCHPLVQLKENQDFELSVSFHSKQHTYDLKLEREKQERLRLGHARFNSIGSKNEESASDCCRKD